VSAAPPKIAVHDPSKSFPDGREVTTIEGLGEPGALDPVHAAFAEVGPPSAASARRG
jgi:hypothetical protein